MIETYELFVACLRRIELGACPDKVSCAELPDPTWSHLVAALPFKEAPVQLLELRRDGSDDRMLWALARACADAGGGVALSVMPVTAPPRFRVEHDGRGAAESDWAGVLVSARRYREAADRQVAEEQAQREAARRAWKPDPRADFSDLFKNPKK